MSINKCGDGVRLEPRVNNGNDSYHLVVGVYLFIRSRISWDLSKCNGDYSNPDGRSHSNEY